MRPQSADVIVERVRTALDLFRVGIDMMEQRLKRKHPAAHPDEIQRMLIDWIRARPGAEHGDAVGRVVYPPDEP